MELKGYKRCADLVNKAKQGDMPAFRQLYEATYQAQLYHLKMHIKDPEELKDALQEVYLLLYQNLNKVNPPTVVIAYLNRLSYFVGKNMARKQYRRDAHSADFEWMEFLEEPRAEEQLNSLENREQMEIVRKTIEKLPQSEQSVIYMRYFQNLRHQDVALSLGITQAGAKFLQKSAHIHMRELLKKEGISSWGILMPALPFSACLHSLRARPKKVSPNPALVSGSSSCLSSGLAAAGMFMALIGGGSLLGAPEIEFVHQPEQMTKAPADIEITVCSAFPIRQVSMKKESSLKADYGKRSGPGSYIIHAGNNGSYEITVTATNGRKAVVHTDITQIDNSRPGADCRTENGMLYAKVRDEGSGVDFDSLYCDGEGVERIEPEYIDPNNGMAVFRLPKKSVSLHLRDLAGNRGVVPVIYRR